MGPMLLALLAAAAGPEEAPAACGVAAPAPGFAAGQALLSDHLAPGAATELSLKPAREVAFAPPPAKPLAPGSTGGVFPLEIKAAGTYRIALSARLWIEVVAGGAPLEAADHVHGAPCSGIAKAVLFRLEPGRYAVQLSEGSTRAVTVKVTREVSIADRVPGPPK